MNSTDIAEGCWSQVGTVDLISIASNIEAIKQELELIVEGQVNRLILCLHKIK